MRVLLINSNRFNHPYPIMPAGLLCIAEALRRAGHYIYFLDLCLSKDCRKDIHNAVTNFRPGLIGVSIRNIDDCGGYATRFLLEDVKNDVISPCKEKFTGPILIGGPAVGISGTEMLDFFGLEYAVCGDGEAVIVELVKRIKEKLPLEGLNGLIIRKNGKILQDPPPLFVKDLDLLPFPAPQKDLNLPFYRKFGSPLQVQTKKRLHLKMLLPPLGFVILATKILKLLRSKQPIWRVVIIKRTIEKVLGISTVQRALFEFHNRNLLKGHRL